MRMKPSIKHNPYSPACGLPAIQDQFDGVLVKYKKSMWVFSSGYFHSKLGIWAMFSKVLPGVTSLASFFCDPRTSSLSGNARNFMKAKLTYGLEMKVICHKKPRKLLQNKAVGVYFFWYLIILAKKEHLRARAQSTTQGPVNKKMIASSANKVYKTRLETIPSNIFWWKNGISKTL